MKAIFPPFPFFHQFTHRSVHHRLFRPVVFWITFMVTGSPLSGPTSSQREVHAMSDKNSEPLTLELITTCMNEAARELGTMDPDDPRGAALVAELSQLMQ